MKIQGIELTLRDMEVQEPRPKEIQNLNESVKKVQEPAGHSRETDPEQMKKAVEGLQQFINSLGKELNIHIHEESNQVQVEVVDPKNQKVIRKIPPDEILELASSIEKLVGVFLDKVS